MISWIQRTFQHHFKLVFGILLAVTIISFIMTIGAAPGIGRAGDRRAATRDFFGRNLGSQGDAQRIMDDAAISVEFQLGGLGGLQEDQLRNYGLQRVAALNLADSLGIPVPGPQEFTDYIKSLRIFAGQNGQFDPQRYDAFRASLKAGARASEGDAVRVVSDDIRIRKVQQLLDGPGYVLPGDVKDELLHQDTLWTIGVATVDYASFKPEIDPTDADLTKYYQANGFRYQIPPRVVAGYVDFPAASYLPGVTVTDAQVRSYYDANPARFPDPKAPAAGAPAKDAKDKPGPDAAFAAVRPQVEAALRLEDARRLATKAASDFAFALYQDKVAAGAPFDAYLAAHKLSLKTLAPFTEEAGPAEFGGSHDVAEAAFKLSADRYYSEAVPTPDGSAVLVWKETQPSRQPLLIEVQGKVRADYIESERRQRFVALGGTMRTDIEGRLKAGDDFAKAAAAAAAGSSVKVEVKMLPAFSLRSPPADVSDTVTGTLARLDKGQVSDMAIADDKGLIVYAAGKTAPDLSEKNPRFAEVRGQIASYEARMGSGAFLDQIVSEELKRTEPQKN
jgi:peptidyl-prolyl cis-trans isomerase D